MKKAQFGTGIVKRIARTKISDVPSAAKSAVKKTVSATKDVAKSAINKVKNTTVGDVARASIAPAKAANKVIKKTGKAIRSMDSAAYKNGGSMGKCKHGCN